MSESTIDSSKSSPAPEAQTKTGRKRAGKAKAAKKAAWTKKTAAKPKADRSNKKTAVIAMLKRAKSDAAREGQRYATETGFPLTFSPAEVEAMAISLYIQSSKQQNINLIHRNEQLRAQRVSA